MLAQLAARLQARHGVGNADEDEEGVPAVVDDNCQVWQASQNPIISQGKGIGGIC